MIFAIRRNDVTYIGTTDTAYNESLARPQATGDDVQYLLDAVNAMFVGVELSPDDVVSTWRDCGRSFMKTASRLRNYRAKTKFLYRTTA